MADTLNMFTKHRSTSNYKGVALLEEYFHFCLRLVC